MARARAESTRHVEVAQRLLHDGRYADAIQPLLAAARLVPNDPAVLNDLGVAYMATRRFDDAVTWLRRSIAVQPSVGTSHYNLGLALQHLGEDDRAIVAHRRATTLSPGLVGAHVQLGDLLWERGTRQEAITEYELAYAAAPETTLGRLARVKALDAQQQTREAEQELRTLVALDGGNSLAHALLGRILQESGRFDEAAASFEHAIALDPWHTNAHYGQASVRRFREADRPLLARLVGRLEAEGWHERFAPAVAERHRMMLHFAIGKALDDLGENAEAMNHFHAANAIRCRLMPFERREVDRCAAEVIARFTPELFARCSATGHDDETPVLIVGMPRSGTTLLERIVSSHSKARGRGELDFWNEHGAAWMNASPEAAAKLAGPLRAAYLHELREGAPDARRVTDKMPLNFFWVGLVHLLFPKARFVFSLRDPLDTCLSIYATPLRASLGFTSALGDLAWYYGLHERLLDHWRAVLPADRWLDVRYEDVVAGPEAAARRLIAFCGLEWEPACARPEANRDEVRTASSWQARQSIYPSSVGRWRRYEPWLGELAALRR
ncbi:MAG TPA: sulfotransferase [Polyangiaceae bacterium]